MVFKDIIDGKVIINLSCNNFLKIQKYYDSNNIIIPYKF